MYLPAQKWLKQLLLTNFLTKFFDEFFWQNFWWIPYLLIIASFRIGVPSILFFITLSRLSLTLISKRQRLCIHQECAAAVCEVLEEAYMDFSKYKSIWEAIQNTWCERTKESILFLWKWVSSICFTRFFIVPVVNIFLKMFQKYSSRFSDSGGWLWTLQLPSDGVCAPDELHEWCQLLCAR